MSKIISPTIGRKVWYWHSGWAVPQLGGESIYPVSYDASQAMDATVIYVFSDRMVSLDVTDHRGNRFIASSVTLVQPGDERPGGAFCEWMPFQVGQAAKAEPAEQQGA